MLVGFTRVSMNAKTGQIPVSMTEQASCPDSCPWKKEKLCYPFFSPLGFQWEALDNNGYYKNQTHRSSTPISWDEFCSRVRWLPRHQLWRHNAAGDLPGVGDLIDTQSLQKLVDANRKARAAGFTYTHKPVIPGPEVPGWLALRNKRAIFACNQSGFTVNVSADSLDEVDELADLGIAPVVVVVPTDAPRRQVTKKGRIVIACPAEKKNGIQCDHCRLCANKDRKAVISFRIHGTKKRQANEYLRFISGKRHLFVL